jgi:signal peptidase I
MAKQSKKPSNPRQSARANAAVSASPQRASSGGTSSHGSFIAVRETIESIVVAFVLAFLFRTFEAEAFVIPTGSMSPALLGRHKDVECDQCGFPFRVTASSEETDTVLRWQQELRHGSLHPDQRQQLLGHIRSQDVVAGVCPMCRHTMPFCKDLPSSVHSYVDLEKIEEQPSYPGDRILVNKYGYQSSNPERWDVVVFKFPGNGAMNYIKRLVGLPGETVRVFQGDIFVKPDGEEDFNIERKPPAKVHAMLQLVHDTDYEPTSLHAAGWPLRWAATTANGWQVEIEPGAKTVRQIFRIDSPKETDSETGSEAGTPRDGGSSFSTESTAWLHYRHLVPELIDWQDQRDLQQTGGNEDLENELGQANPQLITDFNPYNARILRGTAATGSWEVERRQWPDNWVGDLAVECQLRVAESRGTLILDLVEGGKHFSCQLNLSSGVATLGIEDMIDFAPEAKTSIAGPGDYQVRFANVDDQLLLWINKDLVEFEQSTYDVQRLFGDRANIIPRTDDQDTGDLAPVGIGAHGAALEITRLRVSRDIYYEATDWNDRQNYSEYPRLDQSVRLASGKTLGPIKWRQFFTEPDTWPRFSKRRHRDFPIHKNQFFVLGDNSPESADCRLWKYSARDKGIPGGAYLDRRLLTGKAVCVFWPHSWGGWGGIRGLDKLPGFPNFGDMRIIR